MVKTEFITDGQIYKRVLQERLPRAKRFVFIGTSDLKDLHVDKNGLMVPLLEIFSDLIDAGVLVRLLHAKEPGPRFRDDFDRYPNLIKGLERFLCPRVHFKTVIVDGEFAYTGSANLTGAGMGAKSAERRNFEGGIITTEPGLIDSIAEQFDNVWMGKNCKGCKRKEYCSDYIDMIKSI
jgi:phosphatidylserine/phosphatidylglycerophosphate/cardiolipin synthase-like enzyme